jgi:hypothetical protein
MATRMNPVVVDTGVTSQDQFALLSEKLHLFLYSHRKPNKKHNCYWENIIMKKHNNASSQQHKQLKISRKVKSINQSNMTNEEDFRLKPSWKD